MTWRLAAVVMPALFLGACVYQVDSAIPEGQSSVDPALTGTWVTESDTAVISAGADGAYAIHYIDDKGERVRLEGRAGKLGARTVLEVTPLLVGDEAGDWPVARLLLVVSVSGVEAKTQLVNAAVMRAAVARDPAAFQHIRRGENVILTAPTAQLSPALRALLERPGALDDPATWRRIAPPAPGER